MPRSVDFQDVLPRLQKRIGDLTLENATLEAALDASEAELDEAKKSITSLSERLLALEEQNVRSEVDSVLAPGGPGSERGSDPSGR